MNIIYTSLKISLKIYEITVINQCYLYDSLRVVDNASTLYSSTSQYNGIYIYPYTYFNIYNTHIHTYTHKHLRTQIIKELLKGRNWQSDYGSNEFSGNMFVD